MFDAHFHMTPELFASMKRNGIRGIANAENSEEYATLKKLQEEYPGFTISAGIHPWHAHKTSFEEILPVLEEVEIIGEIGLDNVWCDTDMEVQRAVFEKQLQYAMEQQKPVILHTKGMEKEIAETIARYPNRYLVHWYSSLEHLDLYRKLDCFFTIGPSVGCDPAVDHVVKTVEPQRLVTETDGIGALQWAAEEFGLSLEGKDLYREALERSSTFTEHLGDRFPEVFLKK